jgi:hypothetical protein
MHEKISKPDARINQELINAISNLRQANELWEQGYYEQTSNIATILRLLLQDSTGRRQSISLLQQMNMKNVDFYYNPLSAHPPFTQTPIRQLVHTRAEIIERPTGETIGHLSWLPVYHLSENGFDDPWCDEAAPAWSGLPFDAWWKEQILENGDFYFSRETLIKTLANRMGGAHSDPRIDRHENDLLEEKFGVGFRLPRLDIDGAPITPENKVYDAAIRQISYEFERTIAHHFESFISTNDVVPPIPRQWQGDEGIAVKARRTPEEELRLYQSCKAADGEWSGITQQIRSEMYWNQYMSKKQRKGLW